MLYKNTLPTMIVTNFRSKKAKVQTKFNAIHTIKYSIVTLLFALVVAAIYCSFIYIKIVLEESDSLKNSLTTNVADIDTKENNMILKAFSDIIVREGHVSQAIANNYSKWIFESSYEQKVDPVLILAIINTESSFNYQAMSNSNAIGLMQVIYYWHKEKVANKADLYDPKTNIKTGTKIIREYLDRSHNEVEALLRYNGSLGQSPIYSIKVLETKQKFNYEILKKLAN